MALLPGTRLGPYEVISAIGAGGMGEVYKARDTRLDRDVAIKALPDQFANDPTRLARFEREAKVLAALNHPNIAGIHGLEQAPSPGPGQAAQYLVLEYVDGESLAERLRRGAIPLDEALAIARQIAEALEAAHDKGIIHRDLKPANVMLTPEGQVKVLDFGLARVADPESGADPSTSPTLTAMATQMGVILGTAAYMSPEQAKGRVADKRSDVWAFGCVLYEMLTGARAFEGEDVSDTLAFVLTKAPDWSRLPANVPAGVRTLLQRCLTRDRKARIPEIATVRFLLEDALAAPQTLGAGPGLSAVEGHSALGPVPAARPRRFWLAVAGALALGAAVTGAGVWTFARWTPVSRPPVMRLTIVPPAEHRVAPNAFDRGLVFSPGGTHVVYATSSGPLMVRAIDRLEAVSLAGTDGARSPFFSPDGQWVGYYQGTTGLSKVPIEGSPPTALCRTTGGPRGATWGPDETIIFATSGETGLMRVPATGGEPKALTTPDTAHGEVDHLFPEMLPDGQAVLFTIVPQGATENAQVAVLNVKTGQRKILIRGGSQAQYVEAPGGSGGYLVYAVAGTLRAVRFDPVRLEVAGNSVAVIDRVSMAGTGAAGFNASRTGSLAYLPGGFNTGGGFSLVWVDRQGRESPIPAPPRTYVGLRLSPDGNRIALDVRDQENDVWIWDVARRTLDRRTFAPVTDGFPVWTPDGQRIVYGSSEGGAFNVFSKPADGTGNAERLTTAGLGRSPTSFSPDGKRLIVRETGAGDDLAVLSLDGKSSPTPLLHGAYDERNGEISPDGHWMAYESNESGRWEVYVRPFPNVDGGRWQISPAGGARPVWARNGRELFYLGSDSFIWTVPVQTMPAFVPGNPMKLFEARSFTSSLVNRHYDVSPDGQRFVVIKQANQTTGEPPPNINVVLNWVEELKAKVGR